MKKIRITWEEWIVYVDLNFDQDLNFYQDFFTIIKLKFKTMRLKF